MSSLATLKDRLYDVNALKSACALMDWDQQTYMPHGAGEARAEHLSILSRMAHELMTDGTTVKLLEQAHDEADPNGVDASLLRIVKRDVDLRTKLPAAFVAEKGREGALAHDVWVKARKNNDFASFAPTLEKMFELSRREAEYLGYKEHIYDALIDQYEEGFTAADARAMYESIKGPQVALVKDIMASGNQPDNSIMFGEWDAGAQKDFTEKLVQAIGFSFETGRQDVAAHPFCTNFSISDVRLTTRYLDYIGAAIFGSLHEAGHGMYEQGSPLEWDRSPLAGGTSLGVHESQSRTWENIVGRSRSFWSFFLPKLQASFPKLASVNLEDWYRMINRVEPSYIRVEADECTYNLHTMVRFELECDLLTGNLAIKDLPDAWNAKYAEYLGVTPRNDSEGCLQDVHWSGGLIGYFPTYSVGNLLSYQFWGCLQRDLGDTDAMMASGNFAPILGWLQEKVYRQGSRYTPKELVMQVTGKPLDPNDYLAGLDKKYREIYSI
jgi:carboxypeptidase Taq